MSTSISQMVRDSVKNGQKTNIEILSAINLCTSPQKLQWIIKSMIKSGMMVRIGDKAPYLYGYGRESLKVAPSVVKSPRKKSKKKEWNAPYTQEEVESVKEKVSVLTMSQPQRIREAVKMLSMRSEHVAYVVSADNRKYVSKALGWMAKSGNIERLADGRYKFIRDTKIKGREILRNMSVSSKPKFAETNSWVGEAETVEEFLARGGKIDYSKTANRFERLTEQEIKDRLPMIGIGQLLSVSHRRTSRGKFQI